MGDLFDYFVKSGELLDIDTYSGDETYTGYLLQANDEFLMLLQVDNNGSFGSYAFFQTEDVFRVRKDTKELTVQKALSRRFKRPTKPETTLNSWNEILSSLQKHDALITLHFENVSSGCCYVGQIEKLNDEMLELLEYGPLSNLGHYTSYFKIEDITRVELGGKYAAEVREANALHSK